MPKKTFVPPFRLGDVVKTTKQVGSFREGEHHIINKVHYDGHSFKYATDKSAWHPHDSLVLIEECSQKSLDKLLKALCYE